MKSDYKSVLHFYTQADNGDWACWCNVMPIAIGIYTMFQLYTSVPYRRKGLGTQLVQNVMKWADRESALIIIDVGAWGVEGLNNQQLAEWYMKLGWKPGIDAKGNPLLQYKGERK